jgi:UDP-N-acetylmuramate dehydrogenase
MPDLLSAHTTLRLGGPARAWVRATTEAELVEALSSVERPVLVLGGGSNVVVADAGFDGTVVEVATSGVAADVEGTDPTCGGALVTVAAGESWDDFVAHAVEREWVGVEALAGIPGRVGASPIQNIGAYGQEVSETIARVRAYDRISRTVTTLGPEDCAFSYRDSLFKSTAPDRYVILDVTFRLRKGAKPVVRYAEIAERLSQAKLTAPSLDDVRRTVLEVRRAKSMVFDHDDPNRRSCGSFFVNPIVSVDELPRIERRVGATSAIPQYPQPDGNVKLSAAWLIERAGFAKGQRRGAVGLSTRHALALVCHENARAVQLVAFAREIRDRVRDRFGVVLVPEPIMWGFRDSLA